MSQRLDPCRFADIFARFDGVFERIGQSRILLGFHYHPAFIAKVVQQLEHRTEIDHPVARDGEGAFFHAVEERQAVAAHLVDHRRADVLQMDVVDARQILFEDRQHRRFAAFGIPGVAGVEQQEDALVHQRHKFVDFRSGLDAGADDYLVKPFSFQELEARIKALLRRTGAEPAVPLLTCGELTLDPSSHRATRGKVVIDLTVKEYRLLEYLIQNQGMAQSRLTLLKNVWDKNFDTNTNVVDVYVNYLRGKIDKEHDKKLIHTVVGSGYIMYA